MDPFQRKDRAGWWIRYKNAEGRWVTEKGGSAPGEAWVKLEARLAEAVDPERYRARIEETESAIHARRPIGDVIGEYEAFLKDHRRSPSHIHEYVRCLRAVVDGIKARNLNDLRLRPIESWVGQLAREGRSARTCNGYLAAVRALLNWAVRRGMLLRNPILSAERFRQSIDRREISRALTREEFAALIRCTPRLERKVYYLLAGRCGLRWQEIRRLKWEDMDFEQGWVYLNAARTKSGRDDSLPIPLEVAELLQGMRKPSGPVFVSSPTRKTFLRDLTRACVPYETERGQADRKSLRKTFGTHLAIAGVDFRVAVRLMRHSDPKLTQNVYTDPMLLDMKGAIERLSEKANGSFYKGDHKAS